MTPFDYVKSINAGKEEEEVDDKVYSQFLTNRAFSYYPDTILYADSLNRCTNLTNQEHYSYLINSIRPRKRFSKWAKVEPNGDLDIVQATYKVNRQRAKVILSILSPEQLDHLRRKQSGD